MTISLGFMLGKKRFATNKKNNPTVYSLLYCFEQQKLYYMI